MTKSYRSPRAIIPALCAIALALLGCGTTSPRFAPDLQAAVARDMRRMETDALIVYYPEGARAEAERVARRMDACVGALRARTFIRNGSSQDKPRVVLPSTPYNNAYVHPDDNGDPISVVPTFNTTDLFLYLGLPPDPGLIGCHEMTHYIQSLQAGGFNGFIRAVFGPAYTPQVGLDPWFWEGLAVYYETKLQEGVGRLGDRYFEGVLAAAAAEEGLDTSLPGVFDRKPLFGGQYLIGAAFIDWLIAKRGEPDLARVVRDQGNTVLFPIGVEGRFQSIYHQSLTSLFRQFARDAAAKYPKTARPADQRELMRPDDVGTDTRYARGKSGHEALVTRGLDRPIRLLVRDPSGAVVIDRDLTDVLPGRTLVDPSVSLTSGLSFTADGSKLYFTISDQGSLDQASRLVAVDVAHDDLTIAVDDLHGPGGSIAPDGRTYYFAREAGDAWGIAAVDLRTRAVRWIRPPEEQRYHSGLRVSPDGTRLVVVRSDRRSFQLAIVDVATGAIVQELAPGGGAPMLPDWSDDGHIVYLDDVGGRMQAHLATLADGSTRVITHAPYLASAPQSDGKTVRFLNRTGWQWSLDETPIAAEPAVDPRPALPPSSAASTRMPVVDAVNIRSDEPYSSLERILVPQARGPWFASRGDAGVSYGLGANGGDPLGHHRWGLAVGYEPASGLFSGEIGYVNGQLAPVMLIADAAHYAGREVVAGAGSSLSDRLDPVTGKPIDRREDVAAMVASRTFFGSSTVFTGLRYDAFERDLDDDSAKLDDRRFAGYFAAATYAAAETTPYTGLRRALSFSAAGTMFPKIWHTQPYALGDGEVTLAGALPLLLRRLIGGVELRGRYLANAPRGSRLLQVGGSRTISPGLREATNAPPLGADAAGILPPGLRFQEPLAGFEDLARFDRGVATGEVTVRYPLIADWGSLSTFYILPSFMFRQVDLVGFADGATFVDTRARSAAAGGRLIFRFAFSRLALSVQVQVARRLTDDERVSTYVTVLGE